MTKDVEEIYGRFDLARELSEILGMPEFVEAGKVSKSWSIKEVVIRSPVLGC